MELEGLSEFEKAKERWKALSQEIGWFTVFGDVYYVRYPISDSGTHSYGIKQSIYHGDDSVHAFDATGVRDTIIDRVIRSESRGIIRPWYSDLSFFCESTNLRSLKGIKEDTLDFVVRLSIEDEGKDGASEGPFAEVRQKILSLVDPEVETGPDGKYNEFELEKVKERIIMEARPHVELFGLFSALTTRVFALSDHEIDRIFDIIIDPQNADDFLRKRFVEDPKEPIHSFIGQYHKRNRINTNFTVETIGGGSEDFYRRRAIQLWLFSMLSFDEKSRDYFFSRKANFFNDLDEWMAKNHPDSEEKGFKDLIRKTLAYARLESISIRFYHTISTEYAQALDYPGYSTRLYHLIKDRDKVMNDLKGMFFPVDVSKYETKNILLNLGLMMIEACMQKLVDQIPLPIGQQEMRKIIIAKRKANLRKAVLTEELKEEILKKVLEIESIIADGGPEVQELLRVPFESINPRGEAYFEDMKDTVEAALATMGGNLKQELKKTTDMPSTLVKQYGKQAVQHLRQELRMRPFNIKLNNIYPTILALKSRELMFDDATTGVEKRI
ncbi:MAG: hypothetical protein ACTSP4_14930, partial [Candidatus Hodarchaeales archaeon]